MKSLLPALLFACMVLVPAAARAYYIIELANGSRVVTVEYWQEGRETKFRYLNGVVGVATSSVKEVIEKKGRLEAEEAAAEEAPPVLEEETEPTTRFQERFKLLKERFARVALLDREELYELARDLSAFRDEVLKARLGSAYSAEMQELYAMFDTIEERINSLPQ